ncbi:MAG: YkgJ family cysteine cluster protein [Candidatus Nezhaarchaeota archaeon]|nr:YkgJ family cysteine cluster protein [Candidatus Nezhaarchaeota archaeon]
MGFKCLKCGACCINTEMPLTRGDARRLEGLGYRVEEFAELRRGLLRLRNVDGHCFFYDPSSRRCKVYSHRPEGCRLYPFIYVEGLGVSVDVECSAWRTATPSDLEKAAPRVLRLIRRLGY